MKKKKQNKKKKEEDKREKVGVLTTGLFHADGSKTYCRLQLVTARYIDRPLNPSAKLAFIFSIRRLK